MNEPKIAHFEVQKIDCDQWSLGCCVSSQKWGENRETYLFINFFKWSVSIGRFLK